MHDTENFKKNINEDYDIEEELGSGQFAVVRKIVEKETGDEFAAKYVRKKRTKASRNGMSREDIKREIEILQMVDSEKIIKVHDVYETDKEIILVMELLRGGELFDYISKKDFLTEEEAIDFTRQILLGLQHLHSRSVVHLDLKPENILLQNTRRKTIKLVDFGLARVVNENEQVREIMGTPEFVAPEVLNFDTISTSTDMWALGVIAYILLSGASPFLGEDNQETFTNIIQVDYQFDEEYFAEISDEAKDFIRKLLVKNPRKRPTAHDCSRHPWVEEELVVDKKKRQRRRTTQICTFNFKRFVARKRWKMSYNKIRAMNLIAKMGIKPPPGFITEIPPMSENNESVEPKPEEKPSSHKEHKKNQSTINRKKHKQSSNPKPAVEKTDSLTLKTMDIDIGEGECAAEPEPEPVDENEANNQVEPSPVVEEPVDYGSMTKREKRRARGQLRTAEIVKSKKEIDAKQAQPELEIDEVFNGAEPGDENIADEAGDNHNEVSGENAPAMDVAVSAPVDKKPAAPTTVTSTMQIEHKPAGILKKRDPKATRIPSTEDHYFVTLNAALFQQEDTYYQSGLAPTRQHGHGILKHTTSEPNTSEGKTTPSEHVPNGSDNIVKRSESLPNGAEGSSKGSEAVPKSSENIRKISDNRKVSEFTTVVEVNRGNVAPGDNHAENANSMVVGLQVDKAVAHAPEKDTVNEKKPEVAKSDAKPQNSDTKGAPQAKEVAPAPKKPLAKTDNAPAPQRAFSPPPWQRKSSNENLKPTPKPLHGVSKVSLKANRFLTSDKQATPKSPTSATTSKTSNVLGKSKLFQKEPNTTKPDVKKTAATKTNSVGPELKNVACDINLDDAQASAPNDVEISVSKPRAGSLLKDRSDSPSQERCDSPSKERSNSQSKPRSNSQLKVHSDSQSKPRSDSQSKTRSGSVKENNSNAKNNNKSEGSVSDKGMNTSVQDARYRSNSAHKTASHAEAKVLNGEAKDVEEPKITKSSGVVSHSAIQIPARNEEAGQGTGTDVNEELTSSSTHSLSEFTIRPRQNSGEEKAGGFDIMLTIAPPTDEPAQESRAVSSTKTRFTASSSALPDPRSGLPNGKLTSLSTSDVTSPNQGSKYTPQRDFSKYLSSDQPKSIKTTKVPANPLKPSTPNWQVKRNTPPASSVTLKSPTTPTTRSVATVAHPKTTIAPPKTTITPKSPTTPTRPVSVTAKTAAAKVSATVALQKGKKSAAVTSTAYIPRRSFGFAPKTVNQSDPVVKASEPDDAPKLNNNDESKRWSQSSYTSDRSASSSSSDDLSLSNVTAENNALNRSNTGSNEQISVKNPEISRKIENHSERGNLSPRASPVLERKWKATLVLPKESEKVPARDRDIRISSTNAPRKNKFANMRSKWEGK